MSSGGSETVRVVVQAPFDIGLILDAGYLAVDPAKFDAAVDEAGERAWRPPKPWSFGIGNEERELQLQAYPEPVMSEVVRTTPRRLLSRDVEDHSSALFRLDGETEWELEHVVADLWSMSIGMVTATYRAKDLAASWETVATAVDAIDDPGPERDRLNEFIRVAVDELEADLGRAGISFAERSIGAAVVLWTHSVFLVELPGAPPHQLRVVAQRMLGPLASNRPELGDDDAVVQVGLASAAVHSENGRGRAAVLARMAGVHTAIWGAAMRFDLALFRQLETTRTGQQVKLAALEREADELLALFRNVRAFRSSVETAPVHLVRLDAALWRGLSEEWGLPAQLASLDGKMDAVAQAHAQLMSNVANRRDRRLGDIAFIFTAAGLISLGLQMVDFVGLSGSSKTNVTILIPLLMVAVGVWLSVRRTVDGARHKPLR